MKTPCLLSSALLGVLFLFLHVSAVQMVSTLHTPQVPNRPLEYDSKLAHDPSLGSNPISDGWYADPDGIKFGDTYWIYATLSISFDEQTYFDAFSSQDLNSWTKHTQVFSANGSEWAESSFWAPCVVERDGQYYFYYTANNPVANEDNAGIGVAVASTPGGPFIDLINEPIVGKRINEGNPMDPQVFVDDDGTYYLVWGGTRAFIAPLSADMASLELSDDFAEPRDITPDHGYTEGAFMLKRDGLYYFMWSEGGYGTPDYRVAYAMSKSLFGPFNRAGLVLRKDDVADGPGHNSVFKDDDGQYYVVYHRRIIGDDVADHRIIAVDRMTFASNGTIKVVQMT
ncbi:glycoside hydrolase family beta-glycosidase [Emericellopsis atlantica]|uniref:Glycoside hydrolase family beta-glycosidase n=1 Tax=Emericellopsis atlantica TaxID=2614577 RepID=A0A9P7ZHQ1_9HYPO|nr:glycoside hydrolase family beta-glycosidase [Emericellopsis atlantica]KAG9251703.1 glycoside hydrolase family beta-glycosidase [Emericellopsis atlantica]